MQLCCRGSCSPEARGGVFRRPFRKFFFGFLILDKERFDFCSSFRLESGKPEDLIVTWECEKVNNNNAEQSSRVIERFERTRRLDRLA